MNNQHHQNKKSLKVSIMQREFTVTCSEEESQDLIEAATYLDKQMSTISRDSQILGIDRCAIIAALNISNDLLQLRKKNGSDAIINSRLQNLHDKVDEVMENIQQVGL